MKKSALRCSTPKQAVLPILIQDYLDICDPVLTFDRFMEETELEKYLKSIPKHYTGRFRYTPVSMLKIMEHAAPSYRTFGYFINEILKYSIVEIFYGFNKIIFEMEQVDLQHLYIDGSKFEANANKHSWVWKKATEKSRYRLYNKITLLFQEINEELAYNQQ